MRGIAEAFRRYSDLLCQSDIRRSFWAALAGKFQPGMYGLSLFLVLSSHFDYGEAALVSSGAALGSMTTPLRGRMLDRFGYGPVLWPLLALHLAGLGVLLGAVEKALSLPVLFSLTVFVSMVMPPVGTVTRVMWQARTSGDSRTTALALDAILADLGFMVGPILAVVIAHAVHPSASLIVCGGLMAVSVPLALRGAVRGSSLRPRERGHWAGPLQRAAARRIFATAMFFFFGVSSVEIVLASYGSGEEVTVAGGVLLGIVAGASMIGGFILGGVSSCLTKNLMRPEVVLGAISCAVLILAGALALVPDLAYVACVIVGIFLGPCFAAIYGAAGDIATVGEESETQSWVASSMMVGGALGTAVGGWGVQQYGLAATVMMAGVAMMLGAMAGHFSPRSRA
ncbi:MFS transporter [Sanguibacter antarcticus]|nr:MFS transporter [Sanguibacter antarcticus]